MENRYKGYKDSKNRAGWVIRERNERKLRVGAMDRVMIVEGKKEKG